MMYLKIPLIIIVCLLITLSCSKGDTCQDIDIGEVKRVEESNFINRGDIKTLVFTDEEGNIHNYQAGSSDNFEKKSFQYKCTDDDYFYTVDFEYWVNTKGFSSESDETRFVFMEKPSLPYVFGLEAGGTHARSEIRNSFANYIHMLLHNGAGSSFKLSLFTETINGNFDLDEINQSLDDQLKFYDTIILNGTEYDNVYSTQQVEYEGSEIFYSNEIGLLQFTDQSGKLLTYDAVIYY